MCNSTIKIIFAGDFVPVEASQNIFSDDVLMVLKDKDFSIVNLEAPVTTSTNKILKTGSFFKINAESFKQVKDGYFDSVALANNHIRDFGDEGIVDTFKECKKSGVHILGAGHNPYEARKPLRISLKGKNISFLNYTQHEFSAVSYNNAGANPFDSLNAYYDVQNEKTNSDYIFVIYHGGLEYHHYPTIEQVKFFKYLIDIGADAVVTHHSHYYSGVMEYNSRPIFFGLGSFFLRPQVRNPHPDWDKGLIAKIIINNTSGLTWEIIPTIQNFNNVKLAKGSEKREILAKIENISSNIKNYKELNIYWESQFSKMKDKQLALLLSNSRWCFLLKKHFPFLNVKPTRFKILSLINTFRCEAHRSKTIAILEDLYRKMK
jgi:hypothetical protein